MRASHICYVFSAASRVLAAKAHHAKGSLGRLLHFSYKAHHSGGCCNTQRGYSNSTLKESILASKTHDAYKKPSPWRSFAKGWLRHNAGESLGSGDALPQGGVWTDITLAMATAKLLLFLISIWLRNESALCCYCDWFTYFGCKFCQKLTTNLVALCYCRVFWFINKHFTCWWRIFIFSGLLCISLSRGICGVGDSQSRWRDWNVQCNSSWRLLLLKLYRRISRKWIIV